MRLRNIPGAKEAVATNEYVIVEPKEKKGLWAQEFGNDNPIYIEVGMGKGRFIMELATKNPQINYIGIERYDSVLLRALQKTEQMEVLSNLRFICMDARELPEVFSNGEISKIFLNFSDPWPKDRHAKRRLTSRQFFARYNQILKQSGNVEFKTDNRDLFEFSLEEVKEANWRLDAYTFDLHHDEKMNEGNVMTEYEEKFSQKGNPIHKLVASREG